MMCKLKALYRSIVGDWIPDVLNEVNSITTSVCERVDRLSIRAEVDNEDAWFQKYGLKRPVCMLKNRKDDPLNL